MLCILFSGGLLKPYSDRYDEAVIGYGVTVKQFSAIHAGKYKYYVNTGSSVEQKQFSIAGTSKLFFSFKRFEVTYSKM